MREMFERYSRGDISLQALAHELASKGLVTKTGRVYPADRVRRLLKHPFYRGMVQYIARGEVRPGVHEAIIDANLWNKVQEVLEQRYRDCGEKGTQFFLLRGLVRCATCGRRLLGENHRKGNYYRCMPDKRYRACSEPYVRLADLEDQVVSLLPSLQIPEDVYNGVLDNLDATLKEHAERRGKETRALEARKHQLETSVARLTTKLAEGVVAEGDYIASRDRLQKGITATGDRLRELARDPKADAEVLRAILRRTRDLATFYRLAPSEQQKRDLLREVFSCIFVRNRSIERIEYHPPFDVLLEPPKTGSGVSLSGAILTSLEKNLYRTD